MIGNYCICQLKIVPLSNWKLRHLKKDAIHHFTLNRHPLFFINSTRMVSYSDIHVIHLLLSLYQMDHSVINGSFENYKIHRTDYILFLSNLNLEIQSSIHYCFLLLLLTVLYLQFSMNVFKWSVVLLYLLIIWSSFFLLMPFLGSQCPIAFSWHIDQIWFIG